MVKKSVKIALEIFAAFIGFVILSIAALILWLVQAGPIHLPFLTGYIEDAINKADLGAQIQVEDTILTWAGWHRALDFRAVNLHIKDAAGRELALLPEMSVGLSTRALVRGQLAPTRIELIRPEFTVTRRANGTFALSTGQTTSEAGNSDESRSDFLPNLLSELLAPPNRAKPTGYLTQIGIAEGSLTIKDRSAGLTWRVDQVSLELNRSGAGVEGSLFIESPQFGTPAVLEGRLNFRHGDEAVKLAIQLRGFDLSTVGLVDSSLLPFEKTQFQLAGSAETSIGLNGALYPVTFNIHGGPGIIQHNGIFRAPLPLQNLAISAKIDTAENYIGINSIALDLAGAQLSLSGAIKGALSSAGDISADFSVSAQNLTIEKLKAAWPMMIAQDAYSWIKDNITRGQIDRLVAEASLILPYGGDLRINSLSGTFDGSDLTVHYLPPMPPIEGGKVQAYFNQQQLSGQVLAGHVGEVKLEGGQVTFRGLDAEGQFIDIEGDIRSSLKDALALLDHPRLGYPTKLGIKPEDASGNAEVNLALSFPALKDLPFEKVQLQTKAKLIDAGLKQVLFKKDASDGQLSLELDNNGMKISGPVKLDNIPLELSWLENFNSENNKNVVREIQAKSSANAEQTASLGFDFRPFLNGESAFNLDYTGFNNQVAKLTLDLNLTQAKFEIPFLNWQKDAGDAAGGKVVLTLVKDIPTRIDFFSISTDGFNANGSARFTKDGKNIESASFKRFLLGRTNLSNIGFAKSAEGIHVDLGQGIVDAVPLMKTEKGRAKDLAPDKPETPYIIQAKNLAAILMGDKEDEKLTNVDIELNHDPLWWNIIKVNADVPNGKRLVFSYAPDEDKPKEQHRLYVETKDGGAAIRALGIYDSVSGGRLEIKGTANHNEPNRPLRGKLKMSSYRLLNQSFLARFFTVASLTGVIDAVTGEGFLFNEANAEFTKTRDETDIHSFQSAGPSIGVTACGRVNTDADKIDMSGTLAPAYLLNGILNNIPLLGPMLQGGEGKGAFAFTYELSGALSEPKIDINPLSVLTPGFLRGIFGGDEEGCGKEKTESKKSTVLQPNPR